MATWITVYDTGSEGGVPYVVSELITGESLRSVINRGVLATDVVRQDRLGSRCPAVVDVKLTEHARDLDRLGQVDVQDGFRRHPLPTALVRSALVVVGDVIPEQAKQMASLEDDDLVEEL